MLFASRFFRFAPAAAAALMLAYPASALDISGTVQDKFANPIAGAQVCIQGGSPCATSDAAGKFRVSGAVSVRPADPGRVPADLAIRGGRILLATASTETALLEWFDAAGARLSGAQALRLSGGENALTAPAAAEGVTFLKVTTPGFRLTWKIVLGASGTGLRADALPAAAKVSAASGSVTASKTDWQSTVYTPAAETETNAVIVMRTKGDEVLYDGTAASITANWINAGGTWKQMDIQLNGKTYGVIDQNGGAGALYTKKDYGSYRVILHVIEPAGSSHRPNTLFWGVRPGATGGDTRSLKAMQFQPPKGSMWDYRGGDTDPKAKTERLATLPGTKPELQWHQCEYLLNMKTGVARFACCALEGKDQCNGLEIIRWTDANAGRLSPFGLQIHDSGQKQQYKNIEIEADPIEPDRLISVKK